jgi:hypothetical protein
MYAINRRSFLASATSTVLAQTIPSIPLLVASSFALADPVSAGILTVSFLAGTIAARNRRDVNALMNAAAVQKADLLIQQVASLQSASAQLLISIDQLTNDVDQCLKENWQSEARAKIRGRVLGYREVFDLIPQYDTLDDWLEAPNRRDELTTCLHELRMARQDIDANDVAIDPATTLLMSQAVSAEYAISNTLGDDDITLLQRIEALKSLIERAKDGGKPGSARQYRDAALKSLNETKKAIHQNPIGAMIGPLQWPIDDFHVFYRGGFNGIAEAVTLLDTRPAKYELGTHHVPGNMDIEVPDASPHLVDPGHTGDLATLSFKIDYIDHDIVDDSYIEDVKKAGAYKSIATSLGDIEKHGPIVRRLIGDPQDCEFSRAAYSENAGGLFAAEPDLKKDLSNGPDKNFIATIRNSRNWKSIVEYFGQLKKLVDEDLNFDNARIFLSNAALDAADDALQKLSAYQENIHANPGTQR